MSALDDIQNADYVSWKLCSKLVLVVNEARTTSETRDQAMNDESFNLETPDSPLYKEHLQLYRSISEVDSPQVLELQVLLLVPELSLITKQNLVHRMPDLSFIRIDPAPRYVLLESWIFEFQSMRHSPYGDNLDLEPLNMYARHGIPLCRSLFTFLRLLPAWTLIKRLRGTLSPSRDGNWHLNIRLHIPSAGEGIESVLRFDTPPAPNTPALATKLHVFPPVPHPMGRVSLSVVYLVSSDFRLEEPERVVFSEYVLRPSAASYPKSPSSHLLPARNVRSKTPRSAMGMMAGMPRRAPTLLYTDKDILQPPGWSPTPSSQRIELRTSSSYLQSESLPLLRREENDVSVQSNAATAPTPSSSSTATVCSQTEQTSQDTDMSISPLALIPLLSDSQKWDDILDLRGLEARGYLDRLQSYLDELPVPVSKDKQIHMNLTLCSVEASHRQYRRSALQLLKKLCEASDQLPSQLFIQGVKRESNDPVCGGGFGDIYQGRLNDAAVALKRMRVFLCSGERERRRLRKLFCREALIWRQLRHPFILPFRGACAEDNQDILFAVTPWAHNGDVMHYIEDHKLQTDEVKALVCEVACGLMYLHSEDILHGDLRGSNILVDEDGHARICDFGLVTFADQATVEVGTITRSLDKAGSVRWMAPELILQPSTARRTKATDTYAFACTAWEIYAGCPPFPETRVDIGIIEHFRKGERPPRPTVGMYAGRDMDDGLWAILGDCWAAVPSDRISMRTVVRVLSPELVALL